MEEPLGSDGFYEEHELVALLLRKVTESRYAVVGIALATFVAASVPHDGFDDISRTAVVQTLDATSALGSESASP